MEKIKCEECGTENKVIQFGNGYVCICSICKKVLFNSLKKP